MANHIINIGRASDNDQSLTEDKLISGHHLRLSQNEQGEVYAQDLQSTNGTLINERRIRDEQVRLKSGDKVIVGKTEIAWETWFTNINNDDLPLPKASTLQEAPETLEAATENKKVESSRSQNLGAELEAIRAANQLEDQKHNRIFKLAFFIFAFTLVVLLAFWYFNYVKTP